MKEELHLALRALEKNLKDIQAANETVKEIRGIAQSDIQAATKVVKKIDEELRTLEVEFKKAIFAFEKEGKDTIKKYGFKVGEAVKEMTQLNDYLKDHVKSNLESLSQSNSSLFQKNESSWEKHNQELDRVFQKFEDLKQSIEKLKQEIAEVDFPKRLNIIYNSITELGTKIETQSQTISQGIENQKINFTAILVMAAVILVLQLVSFFF